MRERVREREDLLVVVCPQETSRAPQRLIPGQLRQGNQEAG